MKIITRNFHCVCTVEAYKSHVMNFFTDFGFSEHGFEVFEQGSKDDEIEDSSGNQTDGGQVKVEECCRKVNVEESDDILCVTSNSDVDEWIQASISNTASRTGSSSVRAVSPSRFLSRFSFIPGNVSFRRSRATSLGSSRACPIPSSTLGMLNDEEEICAHLVSVLLSSRPSVSSLGSVPSPNEVVESLPVKLYAKSQEHQNDEAAQCYICLVEYDEGECMRVLPCHHEFHKGCIDKWFKEIHRVCPLC